MSDEPGPTVIEDHPRASEVDDIWRALNLRRPEDMEALGELQIIDHEFPLPLCFFDQAHVSACFLEERSEDQIAFGFAYSMCLNPMRQFLEDVVADVDSEFLASPLGLPLAPLLGVAGGITGVWRGITRFAERERDAITEAVDWVHRAGFDPNAGVKMFMSLAGWFAAHAKPRETEPSVLAKIGAMAVFAPITGALSVPLSKDPPMLTAVDRAAAVRTAVVARGFHHR